MCIRDRAGYWGTPTKCDIPFRTAQRAIDYIFDNFNVSALLWTGDNIDHTIWQQNVDNQSLPTALIAGYLEGKATPKNIPVFANFGNHECFPVNIYDYLGVGGDRIRKQASIAYGSFLNAPARQMLEQKGYYSQTMPGTGVKMISLNTQVCNSLNYVLLIDPSDPDGHLAWLIKELEESESKNQAVFIIGHIPVGDRDCTKAWSKRYQAVVERFSATIRGQFFGHTHADHFQVIRSVTDKSVITGVIHITPSLTTYDRSNPSFRIYEIDSETHHIVNYEQYRINVLDSDPSNLIIERAYDFLSEYGFSTWSLKNYEDLAERVLKDRATLRKFMINMYADSPYARNQSANATHRLAMETSCYLKSADYEDFYKCNGNDIFQNAYFLYLTVLEEIAGEWHRKSAGSIPDSITE
eukprot:TRINITY_DN12180_c0_g1_i2.p1 TRINITY_DN12180_c0_g1~~TRINITY_DN12180_c0_g1_i2.p1  ORF type:complete len:411 (+),score=75.60 TRINITY_DN12180_c0_g1_i2:65-1297(+)